jgi:hypothetical protein
MTTAFAHLDTLQLVALAASAGRAGSACTRYCSSSAAWASLLGGHRGIDVLTHPMVLAASGS